MDSSLCSHIEAALVFTGVGLAIFIVSFVVFDRATPGHLWKEIIEERNMAIAVLVGAVAIGISIIIAAAIRG
jgi:putative membrane protein